MIKYPNLFSPIKIGDVVFRNRIFGSPTGQLDFHADGSPTDDFMAYYERKAIGGAATVCVGECHIKPEISSMWDNVLDITNNVTMRMMYKMAERVRRFGAVPSIELQHHGRFAKVRLGPSAGLIDGNPNDPCKAMTEEQILETIQYYADAAERSKHYGFEMVTIHGGHGWLPQQFFSSVTNQRTDKWGGSAENRARFAVAVCDAIHERCGRGFPVEFRISATEYSQGYGIEEGIEYAKCLDGHADIIHCSVGVHGTLASEESSKWCPSMYEPDGTFVPYAAEIKKHIKKSLVGTVGALSDPALMEDIIASGKADIVNVARGLLCDPDLPNKARAGKDSEIRKCIRCLGCSAYPSLFPSGRLHCVLNAETSRENEFSRCAPPPEKQRVLVIGGGVGGMQAAISCARLGHSVLLCEKGAKLGGALLCEANVPFKKNLAAYLETQKNKLLSLGVDIKLNFEVTSDSIEELAPDAVIAALGSKPFRPKFAGSDSENVFCVEEVFTNPTVTGQKVVIVGAGLSGLELGVYLSMLGKQAEIIEMQESLDLPMTYLTQVRFQLRDRGVNVRYGVKAERAGDGGLYCAGPDGQIFLPADTIVLATGVTPLIEETFALSGVSPAFHMIGDCAGGTVIRHAVEDANTIACVIGMR